MRVKLKDIFELQMGKTPSRNNSEYWNKKDYKWISIADLTKTGKYISDTKEFLSQKAVEESGIKVIPANTVVMSFKLSIGKIAITMENMYSNEAIMAFNDKHVMEILPEYIFYLFKYKNWDIGSNKAVMGKTLNKTTLSEMEVEICPIEKQKEIVNILNKVMSVLDSRKLELQHLDELVNARFVEMFGDMYLNSKGWPEAKLESMADVVSGITKGRKTKAEDLTEVPYMAVSNVKDGYIDWTTVKTIEATQQEIEKYRLLADDVLMTEGGDPDKVGRGAIIKEPLENCIHQNHIFRVRLDESMMRPEFFAEYLQHQRSKRYFLGCAKQTTGIASINMTQLRALPVLMPPLSRQEEFVLFKAQVNKSKVAIQKALDKTQMLFDSLMQEYFG
ncbi:restriction endonuclease subunit S [Blautia sp. HCP3S3_C4]|uniref:restriction endonuclease subunit S n=1 Tax=Blautia sp. HCP3S3_C4 TaxID=3438911 RepID=UPI003F8BE4C5